MLPRGAQVHVPDAGQQTPALAQMMDWPDSGFFFIAVGLAAHQICGLGWAELTVGAAFGVAGRFADGLHSGYEEGERQETSHCGRTIRWNRTDGGFLRRRGGAAL